MENMMTLEKIYIEIFVIFVAAVITVAVADAAAVVWKKMKIK